MKNLDFDFYGRFHFVELFCIDENTNCIFQHLVFLHLYTITFAHDTDSKIATDEQNSRTKMFHTYISVRNPNNNLDEYLTFSKINEVVQNNDMVSLLFRRLTVDDC